MIANELRPGDTFVCHSQIEWAEMSAADRKKAKRATMEARLGSCVSYDRIHLRTSAGRWCIPKVAPVVLLATEKHKTNEAARVRRTPVKAA